MVNILTIIVFLQVKHTHTHIRALVVKGILKNELIEQIKGIVYFYF